MGWGTDRQKVQNQWVEFGEFLRHARGNQTEAARLLGISRKALWEKRKRYGLD